MSTVATVVTMPYRAAGIVLGSAAGAHTVVSSSVGIGDTALVAAAIAGLNLPSTYLSQANAAATLAQQASVKIGQPWYASVFAAPPAEDVPTSITVATSSQIGGGTAVTPIVDYYGDPSFRYDGTVDIQADGAGFVKPVQPSTGGGGTYTVIPEFVTQPANTNFEARFHMNGAGTFLGLRVVINGKWLTMPLQWLATTASTDYWLRIQFATAKARTIRLEVVNISNFGGVVVPSGQTVTRPPQTVSKRIVLWGDSYVKGANGNTTSDPATNGCSLFETAFYLLAKLLGADSIINLGVGGTGWAHASNPFSTRVPDVLNATPHVVLAAGSRNDSDQTDTAVYNAAVSALSQLADVPVIEVFGPEDDMALSALNQDVKQAARTVGRRFNDVYGVITTPDKNSADGVHPSVIGAQKLALAGYVLLDRARIDEAVAGYVGGKASIDLTLAASPVGAANVGATVTLTATQSTARAGKVVFYATNTVTGAVTVIGTQTASGGTAVQTTSSLASALYTLSARFIPSNPLNVKAATSNQIIAYNIDPNLGFVYTPSTKSDGVVGLTDNGKTPVVSGGNGPWTIASGKLANANSSGTSYFYADAGTPTVTITWNIDATATGGTGLGLEFLMRLVDTNNQLFLITTSGQITLNKRIGGTSTVMFTGSGGTWVASDVMSAVYTPSTNLVTIKKNGTNVTGLVNVDVTTGASVDTGTKFGIAATTSGSGAKVGTITCAAA